MARQNERIFILFTQEEADKIKCAYRLNAAGHKIL